MAQGMTEQDPLAEYLGHLERLIGDRRTGKTFSEVVRGIINAGSLVCKQIAAHSPVLSAVKEGAQRVTAEMRSRPLRLTYDTHVRREGEGEEVQKDIWLVEVEVVGSTEAMATDHRLASGVRRERSAHLPHVSPTLGRGR